MPRTARGRRLRRSGPRSGAETMSASSGATAARPEIGQDAPFGRPTPATHPNRLFAAAALHGFAPPSRPSLSLLELGCGAGANLIPIAATYPEGRFVGVESSGDLLARAARMAEGSGVRNVTLVEADPGALSGSLGRFDAVIACGRYSRSAPEARDALMQALALNLAPDGIAYLDFDTLPGGWLHRIGWDAMQFHARGASDPGERVARAREAIALLVEAWGEQPGTAAALAGIFAHEAQRDAGDLLRDGLAAQNEPVYLSTVANHARRHGLALVGDAEPGAGALADADAEARGRVASRAPPAREQLLDFLRLRTSRQALVVPASARPSPASGAAVLHYSIPSALAAARRSESSPADPIETLLAAAYPASVPSTALLEALRAQGMTTPDAASRLRDAWLQGKVEPFVDALVVAARPTAMPRASGTARWQASHGPNATNLRHEDVPLADECRRAILACCDGTRDAATLAAEVRASIPAGEANAPEAAVLRRLDRLAAAALLGA